MLAVGFASSLSFDGRIKWPRNDNFLFRFVLRGFLHSRMWCVRVELKMLEEDFSFLAFFYLLFYYILLTTCRQGKIIYLHWTTSWKNEQFGLRELGAFLRWRKVEYSLPQVYNDIKKQSKSGDLDALEAMKLEDHNTGAAWAFNVGLIMFHFWKVLNVNQ